MTLMRWLALGGCLVAALAIAAPLAGADPITVDQENLVGNAVSGNERGLGQSFTPTDGRVDAIEVRLKSDGTSSTLRLDLYAGTGYTGTLLGQSSNITITNGTADWVHFDLTAPATVTAGSAHTFQVVWVSGSTYGIGFASGTLNPYAGGVMMSQTGYQWAGLYDAQFRTGVHGVVPEPASALLVLGPAVAFAIRRRRRMRARVD